MYLPGSSSACCLFAFEIIAYGPGLWPMAHASPPSSFRRFFKFPRLEADSKKALAAASSGKGFGSTNHQIDVIQVIQSDLFGMVLKGCNPYLHETVFKPW